YPAPVGPTYQPTYEQQPYQPPPFQSPSYQQPTYQQPSYQQSYEVPGYPTSYPPYATPGYAYPVQQKTNGLAIGAMTTSIVGIALIVCYGLGLIVSLVGAVLGHIARRQINQRGEGGAGMALAGIIVGWIGFALGMAILGLIVFGVFYAMSFPTT